MISSCREYPWLFGVEADIEDSEIIDNLVSLQNFDWHNKSVLHEIAVHHAVEDIDLACC